MTQPAPIVHPTPVVQPPYQPTQPQTIPMVIPQQTQQPPTSTQSVVVNMGQPPPDMQGVMYPAQVFTFDQAHDIFLIWYCF